MAVDAVSDGDGGEMAAPTGGQQLPQNAVNYHTAEDGLKSCANCGSFMAPDKCMLVQGPVSPSGICDLWATKAAMPSVEDQLFGPGGSPEAPGPRAAL